MEGFIGEIEGSVRGFFTLAGGVSQHDTLFVLPHGTRWRNIRPLASAKAEGL